MKIHYVITTFSPAMFGEKATSHIRIIPTDEARALIDQDTKVVATRLSHERLARHQLPGAHPETHRYAMLKPGVNALSLHYRGPQIPDNGDIPLGAMVTFYLIEVEEYQPE
jgi:hypothetical protein